MRLLKLVPDDTNIPFMRWRNVAMLLSLAVIIGSIALVAVRGLNFGVDFAGGLTMEVRFDQPVAVDELRRTVNSAGVGEGSLQTFGDANTIAIRLPLPEDDNDEAIQGVVQKVQAAILADHPDADFRRVETVSGKVSGELIRDGVLAMLFAMLGISVYVWFRFEWQFGVGVMFGLIHDVVFTFGFFALTQLEFDLNTVAALLTIIGYSINDTIVVYDRVRENLRKYRKMEIEELLNLSLNETLPRTIVTSLSLILALAMLVLFGGNVLFSFSLAMLLGIIVGTYSSIFLSAPILIWLKVGPHTFLPADATPERRTP
ncbi:MAG: protein translocase subunit SecF [Sphingomonadaceae bacterium]